MDCHEFPSHLHDIVYYLQEHTSTCIMLLVLPPELAVEGLRVVAFPLGGTVLLPGEVLGGKELELEMVVGEEGEGPAVSVVFMAAVEDKGAVVDAAVSGEVLVVFG